MGDDDGRPAPHHLAQPQTNTCLRRRVDRGGCIVENEDSRIDQERARDRDPLPLASGERDAALPDDRVVPLREVVHDEVVSLGCTRCGLDRLVGSVGKPERDVVPHRCREEERILGDHSDLATQRAPLQVADVDPVHDHPPGRCVVEPRDERGQGGLAGARTPDERDRSSWQDLEIHLLEHEAARLVREIDALEAHMTPPGRERLRVGPVGDLLRLVQDLEDSLTGCGGPLSLPDPHPEHSQRHDQHREQEVEREEVPDRECPVHDHPPGDEQDGGLRDEREEREERHVERALPIRGEGSLEDGVGSLGEPLASALFL